jgi:hypothetical protein
LLAQLYFESLTGKRAPKAVRTALKNLATGSGAYDQAYKDAMERIEGQLVDQEKLAKRFYPGLSTQEDHLLRQNFSTHLELKLASLNLMKTTFQRLKT